jgi:hypothetical protein
MDGDKPSALDTMVRTVTLEFTVQGGRVFAHNAEPGKLDRQTIELKCETHGSWLFGDDEVMIGSDKHPVPQLFEDGGEDDEEEGKSIDEEEGWRLGAISTMVSLYEVDEAWLLDSAGRNEGRPILGQFEYHEPIRTADGVVNEKWPKAFAWVGIGSDTFRLIRDRLLTFEKYDFSVGLEVLFPEEAVESNWVGRNVKWDGKGQLRITGATIVWKRNDWSPDYRRKERLVPEPKPDLPYDPSREHIEVLEATKRLEGAVSRLATPMWLAAGAIIAFLIFRR